MKYIDIHSHLGFEDYGDDRTHVIKRMIDHQVGTIAVGADLESSKEAVKVAEQNENIWACIGQHPTHNVNMINTEIHHGVSTEVNHGSLGFDEVEFEKLVKNPKVVAVGECGLDYFKIGDTCPVVKNSDSSTTGVEKIKAKQKEIFIKQIEFAIKHDKPLMLHIRDGQKGEKQRNTDGIGLSPDKSDSVGVSSSAFADALEILNNYKGQVRGNLHFFTGKLTQAQKFIDLGFTISFVGLITYINDFDKIIKTLPLESLQAETDAPFVSPVPHRGERNEPAYVIEVYKKIAEIRSEDSELVREQLLKNARRMFDI